MVILFQRFHLHSLKTSSKMKNHQQLSTSLHTFESELLNSLYQISLNSKPKSEIYTFSWIHKSLLVFPNIEKAFAKFIVDIDYPINEWKSISIEEYLKDNLSLLDHLNCISSSISHMSQSCMMLLHGLSLVEASPPTSKNLKEILPRGANKSEEDGEEEEHDESFCADKELIIRRALLVRKRVKDWVCRIIDSSIRGDVESCLETRKEESRFYNSSLVSLQLGVIEEMKRKGVAEEVSEINKGVVQLLAAARDRKNGNEANELRERVEVLGKLLEGIREDVNKLFSESLVRRNELLDNFQHRKE